MHRPFASLVVVALSGAGLGCSATAPPPRPVGLPPTPATVTVENPGGDAFDPEQAALERLEARAVEHPARSHDNTLLLPLADARHWQRVKLWGYPTRVAFRFGDDHYGIVAVWYRPTKGKSDPESCLAEFVDEARPVAEGYGTRVVASHVVHTMQLGLMRRAGRPAAGHDAGAAPRPPPASQVASPESVARSNGPMVVQVVDAEVDGLIDTREYAGAIASYPSWPGTCLLQGFVVVAGKHKELAAKVRDRWVAEGATHFAWHPRLAQAPALDPR